MALLEADEALGDEDLVAGFEGDVFVGPALFVDLGHVHDEGLGVGVASVRFAGDFDVFAVGEVAEASGALDFIPGALYAGWKLFLKG